MARFGSNPKNKNQASVNDADVVIFRDRLRKLIKNLIELRHDTELYEKEILNNWDDPVVKKFSKKFREVYPNMEELKLQLENYSEKVLTQDILKKVKKFTDSTSEVDKMKLSRFGGNK